MKKILLLVVLVGSASMLQAQKLEKTGLMINDLKMAVFTPSDGNLYSFGSDENNYYAYYDVRTMLQNATDVKYVPMGQSKDAYFIINKKLTTVKKCVVLENKYDRFLTITLSGNNVIILVARDQKSEQKTQIIKQTYAKTTGSLIKETVIASFPKSKSERWLFYSAASPDKTKTSILFMIATKKSTVDGYYAAVLDEAYNIEWSLENDLELSNESFSLKSLAVTNSGEMYIAFLSSPENTKQVSNKKSYIDLVYLTEESKDKMNIPLEKHHFAEITLKPLKSGDVYIAALLSVASNSYASEFFSMKINGKNFNDGGIHTKELLDKNIIAKFPKNYGILGVFLYHLDIENILELNNGNIAVVCEQEFTMSIRSNNITSYRKIKGSVTTFFVNGSDASIENVSVMDKYQLCAMMYNIDARIVGGSIFPFVYGNKVAYLFNDSFKKHATPAKYKGNGFQSANGKEKDGCIVLSTQESGEKAKIDVLTGKSENAGRLFRQILFQEGNKLIVLTRNNKEAYIETITLP